MRADGRFSVSHSFSVPGTALSAGCTGDADLDSDRGIQFSGTIDIDASGPCADLANRVGQILGAIRGDAITFSVGGLPDPLAAIECSTIGGSQVYTGHELQNQADATALYRLLEEEIVPAFFTRDSGGVPGAWVDMMKHCLATVPTVFNTDRMVREYLDHAYRTLARACFVS